MQHHDTVQANQRILDAIERGVPIFNRGDAAACAEIYAACIREIVADSRQDETLRGELEKMLDRGRRAHDATAKAWIYRHTLDAVYAHLNQTAN